MVLASLKITHSSIGGEKTVVCGNLAVGFKRDVDAKPNVNSGAMAKVQTQSQENMTYVINGLKFTGASGTLTYANLLALAKINYDGTNAPTMTLIYGKPDATSTLVAYDGSTTAIKVIVKDFNVNFDTKDSVGAYMPMGTISLVETG